LVCCHRLVSREFVRLDGCRVTAYIDKYITKNVEAHAYATQKTRMQKSNIPSSCFGHGANRVRHINKSTNSIVPIS
jgi:hypothetical protein